MRPLPPAELDEAVGRVAWDGLRGARLFVTGGTGFFGVWLLEALLVADARLGLGVEVVALTRDPAGFAAAAPHLAGRLRLHAGDVADFAPPDGDFSHVVHAATSSSPARGGPESPERLTATIVDGTRRVVAFAKERGVRRLLYVSSGAVYGRQPPELARVPEGWSGAPDPLDARSTYGLGKRLAEHLCAREASFEAVIARAFAFVGPHLPLDQHFAIGNFIRDGLAGRPIVVQGDGTPLRSYLYAGDLAAWLWTLLLQGQQGAAYNVGSDEAVSIGALAARVGARLGVPVEVCGRPTGAPPERYVPAIDRARGLGLDVWTGLDAAIDRTAGWSR